jgi:hypothetical protein
MGKYAAVIRSSVNPVRSDIRSAAVLNKTGELSVFLLNKGGLSERVSIDIKGHHAESKLYLYQVSEKIVSQNDFRLEPIEIQPENGGRRFITLPKKSISVLTNYFLTSKDPGII